MDFIWDVSGKVLVGQPTSIPTKEKPTKRPFRFLLLGGSRAILIHENAAFEKAINHCGVCVSCFAPLFCSWERPMTSMLLVFFIVANEYCSHLISFCFCHPGGGGRACFGFGVEPSAEPSMSCMFWRGRAVCVSLVESGKDLGQKFLNTLCLFWFVCLPRPERGIFWLLDWV